MLRKCFQVSLGYGCVIYIPVPGPIEITCKTRSQNDLLYLGSQIKGGGGGGGYKAYFFGNINFEIVVANKAHTCTNILVKFRDLGAQLAPSHAPP